MIGETITVVRPGPRDQHGDPVRGPDGQLVEAVEHTITGVIVAPGQSSEDVSDGDQVTTRWDLYVPAGSDVVVTDRVRLAADPDPGDSTDMKRRGPWIVAGVPSPWRSPFSNWAPGVVVKIERHTG